MSVASLVYRLMHFIECTNIIILHCRNNFVFGECSIRVIKVTALLEYRDLKHLSMAIILGVAITVQ